MLTDGGQSKTDLRHLRMCRVRTRSKREASSQILTRKTSHMLIMPYNFLNGFELISKMTRGTSQSAEIHRSAEKSHACRVLAFTLSPDLLISLSLSLSLSLPHLRYYCVDASFRIYFSQVCPALCALNHSLFHSILSLSLSLYSLLLFVPPPPPNPPSSPLHPPPPRRKDKKTEEEGRRRRWKTDPNPNLHHITLPLLGSKCIWPPVIFLLLLLFFVVVFFCCCLFKTITDPSGHR